MRPQEHLASQARGVAASSPASPELRTAQRQKERNKNTHVHTVSLDKKHTCASSSPGTQVRVIFGTSSNRTKSRHSIRFVITKKLISKVIEKSLLRGPRGPVLTKVFKREPIIAAAAAAEATAQCKRQVVLIDERHWASNIQMHKKRFKKVGKSCARSVEVTW